MTTAVFCLFAVFAFAAHAVAARARRIERGAPLRVAFHRRGRSRGRERLHVGHGARHSTVVRQCDRDRPPLILSRGEIVWVPGLPVAEKFKVDEMTKTVLLIEKRRAGGRLSAGRDRGRS